MKKLSNETGQWMRGQLDLVALKETGRSHRQSAVKKCGICGHAFHAESKYNLFCDTCKEQSALYKYSGWLSEASEISEHNVA